MFYSELFLVAPHTRDFFPNDLDEQKSLLIKALIALVNHIDNLAEIQPQIHEIIEQFEPEFLPAPDIEMISQAFIKALERVSADSWTQETASAWLAAFNEIQAILTVIKSRLI